MENASKALLIAAAILIAIILISLGLIVINQGRTAIDEAGAGVSEVSIQAFNAKFEPYLGTKVSGTKVKSLIDAINSNLNANSNEPVKNIFVKIVNNDKTVAYPSGRLPKRDVIKIGSTYKVEAKKNTDAAKDTLLESVADNGYVNGYLHHILITEN